MGSTIERGASGSSFKAVAEDGSSFFIPKAISERFSLSTGMDLDEQEFSRVREAVEVYEIRKKAMDYLARREHTRQELLTKLASKGMDRERSQQVIEELSSEGLQSDERFAEIWLRTRLARNPGGKVVLAAEMAGKGVSKEAAEAAINAAMPDEESQHAVLEAAVEKLSRLRGITREKMLRRLLRRGFGYREVVQTVSEVFSDSGKEYFD